LKGYRNGFAVVQKKSRHHEKSSASGAPVLSGTFFAAKSGETTLSQQRRAMTTTPTHPPTMHQFNSPQAKTGLVVSDPDHVGVPTGPADRLQEVLPEINKLALRVGGLKQLADIINSLARNGQ
jgi:hypothetical protein